MRCTKKLPNGMKPHNGGKCANGYHGAIGGDITFEIMPTSIGDFLTIKCSCGAKLKYEEL